MHRRSVGFPSEGIVLILLATGVLLVLLGFAHSILGETGLLGKILRENEERPVGRLAWHVWSLSYIAMGALVIFWSQQSPLSDDAIIAIRAFSAVFAGATILAFGCIHSKFHPSMVLFPALAGLLWWGTV